ncbi:MAG TPA: hypothetical protein VKP78_02130 [bacterium]|nr:hypothetical protein [bacterium]
MSAVFSFLAQKESIKNHKVALSIPSSWVDLSFYETDPDLSLSDQEEFFDWRNTQRFGDQVDDLTFQYYPIENAHSDKYFVVAYPLKIKEILNNSAKEEGLTIDFIDLDIFSTLSALNFLEVNIDKRPFAIWSVNKAASSILVMENNFINNYLEIDHINEENSVIKNAAPVKPSLKNDLKSVISDENPEFEFLSSIFIRRQDMDSAFFKKIKSMDSSTIFTLDDEIQTQFDKLDSDLFDDANQFSDYLEVIGLLGREVESL